MTRTQDEQRRRYERIPGRGAEVKVRVPGQPELTAEIVDISRSGVSVQSGLEPDCGTEAQIVLPGYGVSIAARVIRSDGRVVAFAFRQDPLALEQIDRVLDYISDRTGVRAA